MARGNASAMFSRSPPLILRKSCEDSLGLGAAVSGWDIQAYSKATQMAKRRIGIAVFASASVTKITIMNAVLKIALMTNPFGLKICSRLGEGSQF